MDDIHIVWDLEDDPDGNVQHIQDHDVTLDEVEDVLYDSASVTSVSRSSGEPISFGDTASGRAVLGGCVGARSRRSVDDATHHGLRSAGAIGSEETEETMTSPTRIHRPRQQTAEQAAAERAKRKRFQREKPGLSELLASGDYSEPLSQAEYWDLRKAVLRLKQLREAAGLSLADVAERTGIDRAAICRLENGQHQNPTIGTLNRYADALGKRVSFQVVDVAKRVN